MAVIALVGWQYWLFTGGIFRTSSFDAAQWRALNRHPDDASCRRGGMAHDIQTNVLRKGLTKAEVIGLLGEPDSRKDDVHGYSLGMCSGLRIDFDTLDTHFDSDGSLTTIQIVQH